MDMLDYHLLAKKVSRHKLIFIAEMPMTCSLCHLRMPTTQSSVHPRKTILHGHDAGHFCGWEALPDVFSKTNAENISQIKAPNVESMLAFVQNKNYQPFLWLRWSRRRQQSFPAVSQP